MPFSLYLIIIIIIIIVNTRVYRTKLLEYVCDLTFGLCGTYRTSLTKYTRKTSCLVLYSVFVV